MNKAFTSFILLAFVTTTISSHVQLSERWHSPTCTNYLRLKVQIQGTSNLIHLINQDVTNTIIQNSVVIEVKSQKDKLLCQNSNFCLFQGVVEATNELAVSSVVNNTVSGTFHYLNTLYEILPQEFHAEKPLIAQKKVATNTTAGARCGLTVDKQTGVHVHTHSPMVSSSPTTEEHDRHERSKREIKINSHWNGTVQGKRYIQVAFVGDKSFTDKAGGSFPALARIMDISNYINALYKQLGASVVISSINIWETDQFVVPVNSSMLMLNRFLAYRMQHLTVEHDIAEFITAVPMEGSTIGLAHLGQMCTFAMSGGVNMDNSYPAIDVAVTIAHEMGHTLGLPHDDEPKGCKCVDNTCIMAAVGETVNPLKWSSCSVDIYNKNQVVNGPGYCTRNVPPENVKQISCGNGIVDAGEDCDCGKMFCGTKCCDAATCKFTAGSTCSSGPCCNQTTCSLMSKGEICRPVSNVCDLPEYCNGTSEWCPSNHYKVDGMECVTGKAYCYKGECNTREESCSNLFTKINTADHTDKCSHLTLSGTETDGYCNYTRSVPSGQLTPKYQYTPCTEQNRRCGTLYCRRLESEGGGEENPFKWLHLDLSRLNQPTVDDGLVVCFFAQVDVHLTGMRDPGLVPNGAECGTNMMCVNSVCHSTAPFMTSCPNCNNNGVCTSSGQCFCNVGTAPPYCNGTGCGGSITNSPKCVDGVLLETTTTSTTTTPVKTFEDNVFLMQQRIDNVVTFDKTWNEYEQGFGNPNGNYWAGLKSIYSKTEKGPMKIRFEMKKFNDDTLYWSEYNYFIIDGPSLNYRLHIGEYNPKSTAGDAMLNSNPWHTLNGMEFSTKDRDNDKLWEGSCSYYRDNAGWWFNWCSYVNPNGGTYYNERTEIDQHMGITWYPLDKWNTLKYFRIILLEQNKL